MSPLILSSPILYLFPPINIKVINIMKPDSIVGHAKVLLNETKDFVDCDFTCTKMNYLTKIRIFNVTHFKPQRKT